MLVLHTCAILDANANVSQEDNDGESSLSDDDYDEDSDPSDGESNLCGYMSGSDSDIT